MKLNPKKYFLQFLMLIAGLFIVHYLAQRSIMSHHGFSIQTLVEIYIFLTLLSVVHFFAIHWLFKKWPKYAGFIFTGLSLLKMGVSILFLLPFVKPLNALSIVVALNFMGVYFIFLVFEVVFIAKSMGKNH